MSVLSHVLGQLHEVLSVLVSQQRQDPAVTVHALLVLPQTHVEAGALPQIAHVGGVVLDGCRDREVEDGDSLALNTQKV